MVGSGFWQEQTRRFGALRQETIQKRERPLGANYHPDGWNFEGFLAFRGRAAERWYLNHGNPQAVEEFKSIAGLCAVALQAPNTDSAWVEWLDCLRRASIDFKKSELRSNSRARDWRPEPDIEICGRGFDLRAP